jgi:hypothetical protein
MKKTGALVAAAAILTGAALAPATATAAKALPNCAAKKSTTLAATKDARVYSVRTKNGGERRYACRNKKNKRVFLGGDECQNDTEAGSFTLKGKYVGWIASSCGLVAGTSQIRVTDLNTGKTLYSASAASRTTSVAGGQETNTFVADYVMKDNGSVAWIGVFGDDGTTTVDSPADEVQVRRLQPGAPAGGEIVDQGQTVVLESLALAQDGFYYRKGATPMFAPLQ